MNNESSSIIAVKSLSDDNTEPLIIRLDLYRKKLLDYLKELYIGANPILQQNNQINFNAALVLKSYIKDDTELARISNSIMDKTSFRDETKHLVEFHLKNIMIILGHICECMLCDHCRVDKLLNQKCINLAAFKPDISEKYDDIDYDSYIPFSPARHYFRSEIGVFVPNTFFFDGNHPTIDICWCNKDNFSKSLYVTVPSTSLMQRARLQIKTTSKLNYDITNEKYLYAPMVGIFLNSSSSYGFVDKSRTNAQICMNLGDLDARLTEEAIVYFKLLVAHFSGIWLLDTPISEHRILENGILRYLFSTSIDNILSPKIIREKKKKIEKIAQHINNLATPEMAAQLILDK